MKLLVLTIGIYGFLLLGVYNHWFSRAFIDALSWSNHGPIETCKAKCSQHLNTIIRIQTEGGLFSCSCDDK